jgi:glycosyltransferase involved in cell wall biosynthesis
MKFLVISPSHVRGGVENYALKIACAAGTRGWETHAAFPELAGMASLMADFNKAGAVFHPLDILDEGPGKKTRKEYALRFFRSLALLSRLKPDAVQINIPWVNKGIASIVACGFLRIPTQVVFHLAPEKFPLSRSFRTLGLWAKGRNQDWVAVSEHNQKTVSASYGVPEKAIEVIYNGIRLPESGDDAAERSAARAALVRELGLSEKDWLLLTVGRLSQQKGYQDLIDVAERVRANHPRARFLWAGEGELRPQLEEEIKSRSLEATVLMLGQRNDVPDLLRAADLFVFPSHFEGFPFALLEAMVHRTPFVATDACGVSELAADQVHGLLCSVGDRDGLAQATNWAIAHPEPMADMADRAFVRVQEFSDERMLQTALSRIETLNAAARHG